MSYVPEPEDSTLLKTALNIFRKFDHQPEAMKLAIQLNDVDLIKDIFISCTGRQVVVRTVNCQVFNSPTFVSSNKKRFATFPLTSTQKNSAPWLSFI